MTTPEPAPAGRTLSIGAPSLFPLDEAALLVGVPVWTRANDYLEAPDMRPSILAGHMLLVRHYTRFRPTTWLRAMLIGNYGLAQRLQAAA